MTPRSGLDSSKAAEAVASVPPDVPARRARAAGAEAEDRGHENPAFTLPTDGEGMTANTVEGSVEGGTLPTTTTLPGGRNGWGLDLDLDHQLGDFVHRSPSEIVWTGKDTTCGGRASSSPATNKKSNGSSLSSGFGARRKKRRMRRVGTGDGDVVSNEKFVEVFLMAAEITRPNNNPTPQAKESRRRRSGGGKDAIDCRFAQLKLRPKAEHRREDNAATQTEHDQVN